jgi:NAD(P)-dependent dehydrogenase (short-subunit alcohol dehydrogenase family)
VTAVPRTGAVVVTGAARGIGMAIATLLAQSGYRVIGLDLNADAINAAMAALPGAGHSALAGDARDEALLRRACEAAVLVGGLSGFVANAGRARPGPSTEYATSDWEELLSINLTAGFLGARVAASVAGENVSIVFISSINATLGFGGRAAYSAAKAGAEGLVRSLAVEWAPRGIRVNAVAPGAVATEMQAEFRATGYGTVDTYVERIPMGRYAQPNEIAEAVRWLISDRASFVTGAILPVDGGWSIYGLPGT